MSGVAIAREAERWRRFLDYGVEDRIISRSFRLLGITKAGERVSNSMHEAAYVALDQMLDDWLAKGRPCPTERAVTYGLASELAPEYDMRRADYQKALDRYQSGSNPAMPTPSPSFPESRGGPLMKRF